tara:strand:+ start:365 stop:1672 length:1308 start_codon:yes stop_codon:yes gene_type:complete
MSDYFQNIPKILFEGKDSTNPLSFKYYDAQKKVLGKSLEEHLRMAVCYWHTFNWPGGDPFGGQTFLRPWMEIGDPIKQAKDKLNNAFNFFEKLDIPFFCFHDVDIAPEGQNFTETEKNLKIIVDEISKKLETSKVKLLWGTANLFSHRRYMAGAATNPNPEIFQYAAAQVKMCIENTNQLGGQNYVLWGGREGYETILNTDMKQELDQLGRFLSMVAEHKHKIGFKGNLLIEPKPHEPTKHQYDFDCANVYAFLQKYNLENEFKLNIEVNHAILAKHSFEHEIAYALANNIFGSIDINRGDYLVGWDTDQFPNNVEELVLPFYYIFKNGGLGNGGLNMDAKIRRQSIDPEDLFHAHIGSMDTCARTLIAVEKMITDGSYEGFLQKRYEGWTNDNKIMIRDSLDSIYQRVKSENINPSPQSGRQEYLENLLNSFVD